MENKKIQEIFSNAIIEEGFDKYMTSGYRKHITDIDLINIHNHVYEYYKKNISSKIIVFDEITIKNIKILMEHFIESEEYEKCTLLRDQLNLVETKYNIISV